MNIQCTAASGALHVAESPKDRRKAWGRLRVRDVLLSGYWVTVKMCGFMNFYREDCSRLRVQDGRVRSLSGAARTCIFAEAV